jgi:hypothetical protein
MNKENPHLFELKMLTVSSIQAIMMEKSLSQTDACRHFFSVITNKKMPCGFKISTFEKFHNTFRKFKQKIYPKSSQ